MEMALTRSLVVGSLLFVPLILGAQEVCDNGVDDDGDGAIDLNDTTDCSCSSGMSVPLVGVLPNPSFEAYDCLPVAFSQLDCSVDWDRGTVFGSTDYFHTSAFAPPSFLLPLPDGDACVGFIATVDYAEYLAACLMAPLAAGTTYRLDLRLAGLSIDTLGMSPTVFYSPLQVTVFGAIDCPTPAVPTSGCMGTTDWVAIGSATYQADGSWQPLSITLTPSTTIRSIAIGPPCAVPADFGLNGPGRTLPYFFLDDLRLIEVVPVPLGLSVAGSLCTQDLVLSSQQPPLPDAQYQWFLDGRALVGETAAELAVSVLGLGPGTYALRLRAGGGCAVRSLQVSPPAFPATRFVTDGPPVGCAPLSVAFTYAATAGQPTAVRWSFGDGTFSTGEDPIHVYTIPGTYDVSLTATMNGCATDTTAHGLVTVFAQPSTEPDYTSVRLDATSEELHFFSQVSPDVQQWLWRLPGGVPDQAVVPSPQAIYPSGEHAEFTAWSIVGNGYGCVDSASITVIIHGPFALFVPNAFTPDGDGVNDMWLPVGLELDPETYVLHVFDRWGTDVWGSTDVHAGWNGEMNGVPVQNGAYVWHLEVRDAEHHQGHRYTGHVTVLR